MRRLLSMVILCTIPLVAGCILFFVEHPTSAKVGSTVDIEVVMLADPNPAGAQTPVACIGIPVSWGAVQSVTYDADINGITPISGSGTMSAPETAFMNASYSFTTNSELAAWQCYAGAYTDYGTDTYGTVTFQVEVGSSGFFTLLYSVGTVSDGADYSMAAKSLAVNTTPDDLDLWYVSTLEPDTDHSVFRVAYGAGNFAAAGFLSQNIALSSDNGRDWIATSLGLSNDLMAIAYGNGQFLILDDSGFVARSSDGSSWPGSASIGFQTRAAVYGIGVFVAVGAGGLAAVSSDGAIWNTTQASLVSTDVFLGAAYGDGKFSAVGYDGTNPVSYGSTNGTTWIGGTITGIVNVIYDVAYGNGRFVAVGSGGRIMWSTNGYGSWNLVTSGTSENLQSITYGNGLFVVVGSQGTILTSADGANWTERASGTDVTLYDVAAGDGGFVVVGESGLIIRQGLAVPSGGGGGGGGCSTAGPAGPAWLGLLWIAMLGGVMAWRRRRAIFKV